MSIREAVPHACSQPHLIIHHLLVVLPRSAHQGKARPVSPYHGLNASKLPEERQLSSTADHILPLYVFDERELELSGLPGYERKGPEARTREFKFWKTGAFRAR